MELNKLCLVNSISSQKAKWTEALTNQETKSYFLFVFLET